MEPFMPSVTFRRGAEIDQREAGVRILQTYWKGFAPRDVCEWDQRIANSRGYVVAAYVGNAIAGILEAIRLDIGGDAEQVPATFQGLTANGTWSNHRDSGDTVMLVDLTIIGSVPTLVITKSRSVVPSGRRSPVPNNKSSRIARFGEWPGVGEPGKKPRARAGGAGCLVASMVNWFCAASTRTMERKSSGNLATMECKRFIGSLSKQSRVSIPATEVYSGNVIFHYSVRKVRIPEM